MKKVFEYSVHDDRSVEYTTMTQDTQGPNKHDTTRENRERQLKYMSKERIKRIGGDATRERHDVRFLKHTGIQEVGIQNEVPY